MAISCRIIVDMVVLIFEDNPDLAEVYQFQLDRFRLFLEPALSPEAEDKIRGAHVVVSDYHLGEGAFRKIQELCAKHEKPLIVVTGDLSVRHPRVFYKPFLSEELIAMIKRCAIPLEDEAA